MSESEDELQSKVAKWLNLLGWLWFHCPNGGKRGKVEAARLKGLGVKAGVPDVLINEPWQTESEKGMGVAIELKVKKNKPSDEQLEWLRGLKKRGWLVKVCRDLSEVEVVLSCVRPLNGRATIGG